MSQWIAGIGTQQQYDLFARIIKESNFEGELTMKTSVIDLFGETAQIRFAFKPFDPALFEVIMDFISADFIKTVELCVCPEGVW